MRYEIEEQDVIFYLENPKRVEETNAYQSFAGTGLLKEQVIPLLDSMVRKYRGQSLSSQISSINQFLRPFFAYFRAVKKKESDKEVGALWPTTSTEWQLLIIEFIQFFLTDTESSEANAGVRIRSWQTKIGGLLEFFKEEEIIPNDVKIPKLDKKKVKSLANNQPLLGQGSIKISDGRKLPQKLIVDISFGMTDACYLDQVEKKCRYLVDLIQTCCLDHWNNLLKDVETGRKFAELVTDPEIEDALEVAQFRNRLLTANGTCRPILFASRFIPKAISGRSPWSVTICHIVTILVVCLLAPLGNHHFF